MITFHPFYYLYNGFRIALYFLLTCPLSRFAMATHPTLFIAPTRIGDAVLSTSILRHIEQTDPHARVSIITSPLAAPLFEGYPLLERIISVQKQTYNRHWWHLLRQTIGKRWYALWDMRHSILSYALMADRRHVYTPPKDVSPKVRQYAASFRINNLPHPTLWSRQEDTDAAQHLLPNGTRYLIFAPIANWPPKEWPLTHFIAGAELLLKGVCRGYRPVIICAEHERERANPLLEALAPYQPIDLTGGTAHLLTLYAAMQRAHGFVGNDSGLMHMAATAGIPTLGLFGPTSPEIYQPYGKRAGYLAAPDGDLCRLTPAEVAKAFARLIPF